MKKPELLIPAGNLEKLQTALLYGADAIYVGVAGLKPKSMARLKCLCLIWLWALIKRTREKRQNLRGSQYICPQCRSETGKENHSRACRNRR